MSMPPRLYFVAGEASGDLLGRETLEAILKHDDVHGVRATGGPELAKVAEPSGIDISALSVLGLWEGVKVYDTVRTLAEAVADDIISFEPDAAVLIDSWGFTLRVAQSVRARAPHIRLVKLIGPQVWATRPGRARTLAAAVDHLLCIHDFEVPFYEPYDLPTTVIGHPALNRAKRGNGARFREAHDLPDHMPILGIFPGSRTSEIERMAGDLIEAARQLKNAIPELAIAFAPTPQFAGQIRSMDNFPVGSLLIEDEAERFDLMAASTVALAVSGTVTTEIAAQGAPVITGYKTGWLTWFIARNFLMKAPYISLVNMTAGREVMPELLQGSFRADNLVSEAGQLLATDGVARNAQIAAQNEALVRMGQGGRPAVEVAAEAIREVLKKQIIGR